MQFIAELLAVIVVWAAGAVFTQFGIEIDLSRVEPARERIIERTQPQPVVSECPTVSKVPGTSPGPVVVEHVV